MQTIQNLFLSLTAAAVLVGIIRVILGNNSIPAALVRVVCTMFMVLTAIAPLIDYNPENLDLIFDDIWKESTTSVNLGKSIFEDEVSGFIIDRCQTYIEDRANEFGLNLQVEVLLNSDDIPKPVQVRLCGEVSPYAKERLSQMIQTDLGIPKEDQFWIE